MIAVLLLLLLIVWAAVLLPPWLRGRAEHSPQSSIAGFNRRLSVLAARAGAGGATRPLPGFSSPLMPIPPPASRGMVPPHVFAKAEMQRRRKTILEGLLIGAGCTFVLG